MLRAAGVVWALLTIAACVSTSCALGVDTRQRQLWDGTHPLEVKPYQFRDDNEPMYDCALQYYYYIPCPTYSWFWGYSGWEPGDVLGASFTIGDQGTGGFPPGDIYNCDWLEGIQVLDLSGCGVYYPGLFTIELDVYCADERGRPCDHLWNSGPLETDLGWNYFFVDPPVHLFPSCQDYYQHPSIVVTMTFTGKEGGYPVIGFDNIGTAVDAGCLMHDYGCYPAHYPRSWVGGDQPRVHSGYVGSYAFEYWPPLALPDGMHAGGGIPATYGYAEAAWRAYVLCEGWTKCPEGVRPTSWGGIKDLYK
jgi:hypothetical protein